MADKPKVKAYRVHTTVTALKWVNEKQRFTTIPRGSVITITGIPNESNLVDIVLEGEGLTVFNRDIEERAEELPAGYPVEQATPGPVRRTLTTP